MGVYRDQNRDQSLPLHLGVRRGWSQQVSMERWQPVSVGRAVQDEAAVPIGQQCLRMRGSLSQAMCRLIPRR